MTSIGTMAATTVTVHPRTLDRLRQYKAGGKTYDHVLNELMDALPPRRFLEAHLKALKTEEFSDWREARKRIEG